MQKYLTMRCIFLHLEIKGTRIIDAEDKKRHNIARFQCDYNKKLQDCLEFATFSFRQEWLEWKKYPLQIPAVFSPHFRSKGSIKMGKLFDYGPLNWLQIPIPEASQGTANFICCFYVVTLAKLK